MKLSKKEIQEYLKLVCAFCLILLIYALFTGCPIKLLTGVSCAGCGMSRAYLSLLHLNFREAFHFHPLFICPIVFIAVFIMTKFGFSQKKAKSIYCIMLFLFIGVYVYRMANPNDGIVVFEPQNGLIFKTVNFFISIVKN